MENQMQGQAVVKNGGKLDPNKVSQTISLFTEAGVPINLGSGGEGGGQVDSIVAGENITVDNADPANPVISSSGGEGVPIGGSMGQVLAKSSNDDFDTTWVDQSGGDGGGSVDESWEMVTEPGTITGEPRRLLWVGSGDQEIILPPPSEDTVGKTWVIYNQFDGPGYGLMVDDNIDGGFNVPFEGIIELATLDIGEGPIYGLVGFHPGSKHGSGEFWSIDGWKDIESGGGGGGMEVLRLSLFVEEDIPTTDDAYAGLPAGFIVAALSSENEILFYETNGTTTIDPYEITTPLTTDLFVMIGTWADTHNDALTMNGLGGRTTILPVGWVPSDGFDGMYADYPVKTNAQNVEIGKNTNLSNIITGSERPVTLSSLLGSIDNKFGTLYPEPPSEGTYTLQSVDGVLSWVEEI